ncbi:MAG: hypothetical protein ACI9W4_000520 [Rhodothermales bacterium]|jgi:hypothetical protein
MIRVCQLLAILLLTHSVAQAQLPDSLSTQGRIYVVTTLPGDLVYNRYGHTAIRVFDRTQGLDVTFNYGTFDFAQPGFVQKFVDGELDYFLSFSSTRKAAQSARLQDRTMRQQLLDINRQQRDAIYTALIRNARPENREYRYDFLFDNCATRPRDIIADALGDQVEWDSTALGMTFRKLLDPYHADAPALDLGTDLVLGSRLDEVATSQDEAFLPIRLEALLAHAWVEDQYGRRPLVLTSDTLIWSARPAFPERTLPWPLLLSGLIMVFGLATLKRSSMRHPLIPTFDKVLLGSLGAVGIVLLYMATLTAHQVTGSNFNMLWALPTHLLAAWYLPRTTPRIAGGYLLLTAFLAALALTGGWLLPQPVPVAAVPLIILVMVRSAVLGRRLNQGR